MLYLISYIWICLLASFALGWLICSLLLRRRWSAQRAPSTVEPGVLESLQGQLEALKAELATARTERDRVRAESIPLNTRLDTTLAELEVVRQKMVAQELTVSRAQEQVQAHAEALQQANANIRTANLTIQAAQSLLKTQEAELERLKALLPTPLSPLAS